VEEYKNGPKRCQAARKSSHTIKSPSPITPSVTPKKYIPRIILGQLVLARSHVCSLVQLFFRTSPLEHAHQAKPSPDTNLRAIQICARLNGTSEWVEPPKHAIFSSGPHVSVAEPEPASQTDHTFRANPAPQQLPQENASHPQLSPSVSISTDEPDPYFLIDTSGD
jgi:hypothetical protein